MNKSCNQVINAGCACAVNEGIWFVHYVIPVLMFYSFSEEKVTFAKMLPCEEVISLPGLYSGIQHLDHKLFIFSRNAKQSFVYDIKMDSFSEIDLEIENPSFAGACAYDGFVYAILSKGDGIIKLDINNGYTEVLDMGREIKEINGINFVDKRYAVCADLSANGVYEIDLKEVCIRKIEVKNRKCSLGYVDYYDKRYYGYDIESKTVLCFDEKGSVDKCSKVFDFDGALLTLTPNQRIILDSNYSGDIFLLNRNLEIEDRIQTVIHNSKLVSPYLKGCWICYEDKMYGILKSNEMIVFGDNQVKKVGLAMDEEQWEKIASEYVDIKMNAKTVILEEDDLCGLKSFLDYIK